MSYRFSRFVLLSGLTLLALSPAAAVTSPADREVLALDDSRIAALKSSDAAALDRIYAEDYRLITQTGAVRKKREQVAAFKAGLLHYTSFELLEREVAVTGNVGVVWSREKATIVRSGNGAGNGPNLGGDLRYTRVYVQRNGRWQLLAAHASAVESPR